VLIVLVNRRRMFTREGAVTEILMPGEEAGSGAEHTEPAGALTAAR
jgi:hypothetical protein